MDDQVPNMIAMLDGPTETPIFFDDNDGHMDDWRANRQQTGGWLNDEIDDVQLLRK